MKPPKKVNVLGMELEQWNNKSCVANFGVGEDWATLYDIKSKEEGLGQAQELMKEAKTYYEDMNKRVGGTVALHSAMSHLYQKLGYIEYII